MKPRGFSTHQPGAFYALPHAMVCARCGYVPATTAELKDGEYVMHCTQSQCAEYKIDYRFKAALLYGKREPEDVVPTQ